MKTRLPIGISDFKRIIDDNYYFVDKSLFIKEIIEDGSQVILLPRPRRFGKTLNMSMLKYFYEKCDHDNSYLFKELMINKHEEIMRMQGKYPVIYITFKDEKHSKWEDCKSGFQRIVREEFIKHDYILESNILKEYEKKEIMDILKSEASYITYLNGLKILTKYLYKYHKEKVVILIDEYDVPIQSGFMNGYYDEVIEFMRNFLSGGLKDNDFLEKAVLTGILRVAKESIFSGLNNLSVSTIVNYHYSDSFGFLYKEVKELLKYFNKDYEIEEIRKWYNGYNFGDKVIYNPWSILNFIKNDKEGFKPYWVNTSSNDLVKRVLAKGGTELKTELEDLINGKEIEKVVNENIVMHEIETDANNAWSFLLFSGYLKVVHKRVEKGRTYCSMQIPNLEVKYLYEDIILAWFRENINSEKFNVMLKSLVSGDIKIFSKIFREFVLNSVSYFDVSGKESEKVYHSFVLGILIALSDDYEVKSNKESGYGRYDIMIIPRDINKKGIILEFKKVDEDDKETLEKAAKNALKQIEDRNYKQELIDRGIKDIIKLGIAFEGKKVFILS
ncbi:putative AAA-ATPase [Clostridium tepidiprofundi DSM 19306]|uniref:Putative AAA-ATPase n=1 Tax=Clostridium tepidiprofundi DSM 19306 TaxID=1121338 RepID=A0A151AXD3_9CLOT|nr:AAA family ATPase [Clostridium tepidiprofundi]KYH32220.1 putative AAA-ATPase [Clostridium tepidiprofundi DSM 19306]